MKKVKKIKELLLYFSKIIVEVQTSILLFLIYFTVFVPIGLIMLFFKKVLGKRKHKNNFWVERKLEEMRIEKSYEQY
jgi:hypothetical protein